VAVAETVGLLAVFARRPGPSLQHVRRDALSTEASWFLDVHLQVPDPIVSSEDLVHSEILLHLLGLSGYGDAATSAADVSE
jgi:hypothetical protein